MSDWIAETFTSTTDWDHLETLVDIGNRMAGSEGERAGAEATRDALAEAGGRNVRMEPFDIQGWSRGSAAIRAGETTQECFAVPRSPAGAATGDLVDLGHGLPDDFDADLAGDVVMVESGAPPWYDRPVGLREKYYAAVDGGAAAFVFQSQVEGGFVRTGIVGSWGGEPGERSLVGEIPAVSVSKEVGDRLARRWDGQEVTVDVDADIHEATSQNVHADVGPETETEVLVASHVDAHDLGEGAVDNGSGTAVLVEILRALTQREADLDTRVHAVAYGAEEVGVAGSSFDAARRDFDDVAAILNIDGIGHGRTLNLFTHEFDGLDSAAETVADRFDHPIETTPTFKVNADHWPYVQRGVPGIQAKSTARRSGRGWGHTRVDTIDKLEWRNLREQAILLTELVVEIASDGTELRHRDTGDIVDRLESQNLAEGMKRASEWPY